MLLSLKVRRSVQHIPGAHNRKTQCERVAEQSEKEEGARRRLAQPGQDFLAGDFHCSGRLRELVT